MTNITSEVFDRSPSSMLTIFGGKQYWAWWWSKMRRSRITDFFSSSRSPEAQSGDVPAPHEEADENLRATATTPESALSSEPEPASASSVSPLEDPCYQKCHPPSSFHFPPRTFGSTKKRVRSCQASWFITFPWLHYDMDDDRLFCDTCVSAIKKKYITFTQRIELTFINTGFTCWNDAVRLLRRHQQSQLHSEAVLKFSSDTPRTDDALDEQLKTQKELNRANLKKVIRALIHLARQNLAIRGTTTSQSKGESVLDREPNSNFAQLLKLMAEDNVELANWLRGKWTWTSPDNQNELLAIMSQTILRHIAHEIRLSEAYTLMVDESPDCSNKEQVTFCLRWVDSDLEPHEEFIGLYQVERADAASLVKTIKDVLLRLNLPISMCHGQCYDGAAVMAGARSGVATQILQENPRALYVHCYAHALNLAVQDATKQSKPIKDALNYCHEIIKVIKRSPKKEAWLERLKREADAEVAGKLKSMSFTRWTVRADSMKSLMDNYSFLLEFLDDLIEETDDGEDSAKYTGIKTKLMDYYFLFGLVLGETVYRITDNLSRTLQLSMLTASGARDHARTVSQVLKSMRTDQEFDAFKMKVDRLSSDLGIAPPVLPRQKRAPPRFDALSGYHHETVTTYLRAEYFTVVDAAYNCIYDRFNQPGMLLHVAIEKIILSSFRGENVDEEDIDRLTQLYQIDREQLVLEMDMVKRTDTSFSVISDFLPWIKRCKELYPQLAFMAKCLLLMPASNAVSERSFSAMARLKTSLRNAMGQSRLNSLLLLHVHCDQTDRIDIDQVIQEFVDCHCRRSCYIAAAR